MGQNSFTVKYVDQEPAMSNVLGDKAKDWISVAQAVELVTKRIYPQASPRSAKNKVRLRIGYAKRTGRFECKYLAGHPHLHKQAFERWAVRKWPELSDVFNGPERSVVNLGPDYSLTRLPPSLESASVYVPDDHDDLKALYLCAVKDLETTKWELDNCRTRLADFVERDAALRKKKIEAGQMGKGVPRRRSKR